MRFLAVTLLAGIVAASPAPAVTPATAPCTVTAYTAVSSAVATCTDITLKNIAVPAGATLDLKKLKQGSKVTFAGTTTFGFKLWKGDLISIAGTDIHVTGAPGHVIDGNGSAWWDGQGSNGGWAKPNHFIALKLVGKSLVENLYIRNYPVHCFSSSGCMGMTMRNIFLDNRAGDAPNSRSKGLPASHNSDGFGFNQGSNILLTNSTVYNQDDCVAITSGDGITVSNMYCSGGHGLSIGSVGGKSANDVSNILFKDSTVTKSENGCRIKTNSGTTGSVIGVTYQNIKLSEISIYGIDIQQDYLNGGPTGTPTNGVKISNIKMIGITGTATAAARNYYILCGSGSCSNFQFTGVNISGGGQGSSCNFGVTSAFTCKP